jgi:hypothetical protein
MCPPLYIIAVIGKIKGMHIAYEISATTSSAGGMRKAPRRGRGHALLVVADL